MLKKVVKNNKQYITALLIIMLILTVIMKSCIYSNILSFDEKVINYVSTIRKSNLNCFFVAITEFGNVYIPIIIILLTYVLYKKKIKPYTLCISYVSIGLFSVLIKFLVLRPRPTTSIIDLPITTSFPSAHSLSVMAFFLTLSYVITYKRKKSIKILCYSLSSIIILLVGLSRIYLGVHYFSDVVGGYIYGFILFLIIKTTIEVIFKRKRVS